MPGEQVFRMVLMNRPRWLILICCVLLAVITGLIAVGILAPGMNYAAFAILYIPLFGLILLGVICEGILRYAKRAE